MRVRVSVSVSVRVRVRALLDRGGVGRVQRVEGLQHALDQRLRRAHVGRRRAPAPAARARAEAAQPWPLRLGCRLRGEPRRVVLHLG